MTAPQTIEYRSENRRPQRNLLSAMGRGWLGRCPSCGGGGLFRAFLKPVDRCPHCQEEFHHHRADDLPPYLVIFVVGHIVVGGYMMAEGILPLSSWQHLAIWTPLTLVLSLIMLQPTKGAVIGLQWANYMHGFGDEATEPDPLSGD